MERENYGKRSFFRKYPHPKNFCAEIRGKSYWKYRLRTCLLNLKWNKIGLFKSVLCQHIIIANPLQKLKIQYWFNKPFCKPYIKKEKRLTRRQKRRFVVKRHSRASSQPNMYNLFIRNLPWSIYANSSM